ncbi:MAG: hypothetical protein VB878_20865 [Pirellulaceae bacterium]
MKSLFLVCLLLFVMVPQVHSAPWRRTVHGWERATWLSQPTLSEQGRTWARRQDRWQQLHPGVVAALQLGGAIFGLVSFSSTTVRKSVVLRTNS